VSNLVSQVINSDKAKQQQFGSAEDDVVDNDIDESDDTEGKA